MRAAPLTPSNWRRGCCATRVSAPTMLRYALPTDHFMLMRLHTDMQFHSDMLLFRIMQ